MECMDTGKTTENSEIRNRKEADLLNAARDLFFKFGYRKVTVEDICRQAQVSKMTFYKYFSNKKDIFKQILKMSMDEGYELLDELSRSDEPFSVKIKKMLDLKQKTVDSYSPELIQDILSTEGDLVGFFREMTAEVLTAFVDFIKLCQARGEVRPDMKPEFLLAVITQLSDWVMASDIHNLYDNYTDFALEVNKFLFYGILPIHEGEDHA